MKAKVAVLLLLASLPLSAQTIEFVASGDLAFTPGLAFPRLLWQLDLGSRQEIVESIPALAPAPSGNVVAAFLSSSLWILRPDGTRIPLFDAVPGYQTTGLVFDRTGKSFLLAHEDLAPNRCSIIRRSATGEVEAILSLAECAAGIELAADQCTLLLPRDQVIRRFDGCTGTPLPDFAVNAGPPASPGFFGVRILPDGSVLATIGRTVRRYDAQGSLIRTYTFANFISPDQLAVESSGSVLFTDSFSVFRLDLDSGAYTELEVEYPLNYTRSIVAGQPFTAALGPVHLGPNAIPTLGWQWMVALAVMLGAIAAVKMGR